MMTLKKLFFLVVSILFLFGFSIDAHRGITAKAFDYLPEIMDGFVNRFSDPVLDSVPPYYMLPDIEEPGHTLENIAALTAQYFHQLVQNLLEDDLREAEKNIGRIAHLIGDAVSPTQNDPRTWGDIDDYYDFNITDPFFDRITITVDRQKEPLLVDDIEVFVFDLARASVRHNDYLMMIYERHRNSPETVFDKTKDVFDVQMSAGVEALRDILFTAWDQAGKPEYFDDPGGGGCSGLSPFHITYRDVK